ncbi:hypothetical protein E3N88_21610 [Mikania micrantha]|uniref:Uncharacterized protein n=1 Tax=Mikania micrantha TaxID=192012 RepID=A0A5N6N906_9ASTR|nr:hypothetical protein E3N88_21610 [Mikania micrantha]
MSETRPPNEPRPKNPIRRLTAQSPPPLRPATFAGAHSPASIFKLFDQNFIRHPTTTFGHASIRRFFLSPATIIRRTSRPIRHRPIRGFGSANTSLIRDLPVIRSERPHAVTIVTTDDDKAQFQL